MKEGRKKRPSAAPDFRALFENTPDLSLVLKPDLTIVAVSETYLAATLTRRAEILGRSIFDVFPDNPDDSQATGVADLIASFERVLSTGLPDAMPVQKYDILDPRADSARFKVRYWSPLNTPVLGPGGRVVYIIHRVEEVTEMALLRRHGKKVGRAWRESEDKYRNLFSRASDAIVVFDSVGKTVLDVNQAALDLYGYTESDFFKLTSMDLDAKYEPMAVGGYEKDRRKIYTRLHKKADGRVFPAEFTCASFMLKKKKLLLVLIRDVTERERATEVVLMRERELIQRQLVATISHELRTPISLIKVSAETMLGETGTPKTRRRFLKVIENHANGLSNLVDDLLIVAELESGITKPTASAIPLADFLKTFLSEIFGLTKRKTISIVTRVDPGLVVLADRSHLIGIFQNLVDNAIKYNKKNGSIEIKARRNADGEAEVSVRDTGVGIPATDLLLIFQQFHRAGNVRELFIKGTGLGLYIVKTMVNRNGGRIWAESAEEKGTVFYFTLPLERD